MKKGFTIEEAMRVASELHIDWNKVGYDVEQFRKGLDVELEHGKVNPDTNVTNDDPVATGKIALAHLNERDDYYTLLEFIENGTLGKLLDEQKQNARQGINDAVENYSRTVSFASQNTNKERTMSEHPNLIKVNGHLYQLQAGEEQPAPDYIRVKGMLFQRDDTLTREAAKKKDEKKAPAKKAPAKKDDKKAPAKKAPAKKDDKAGTMSWKDLPKGWTKKSPISFWGSIGGSFTECKRKLKGAKEIDNANKFCGGLKALMKEEGVVKTPPKKSKKKASVASRFIMYQGTRYQLEE